MLYTQIGVAFVAGVVFAATLIPINRWLAKKIAALSVSLLEAKDARVSQSVEALSGAKQIKILAWEDVFIDKIQGQRHSNPKSASFFQRFPSVRFTKARIAVAVEKKIFGRDVRVLLGNDANHHQPPDIQCINVPWTANDGRNDIRQCSFAQHADRTVECISVGFEWFGRSLDLVETCANLFRCKRGHLFCQMNMVPITIFF